MKMFRHMIFFFWFLVSRPSPYHTKVIANSLFYELVGGNESGVAALASWHDPAVIP